MADTTVAARDDRALSFIPFSKTALDGSIVACFRKQVSRHAERIAVATRTVTWSYGELDRLTNSIANTLLDQRGDRLEPIAIMMDQGALAVAAILGAIKAGKIYVPLDPVEAPS